MSNASRSLDLKPVVESHLDFYGCYQPGETLAEYIERTLMGKAATRLARVWGWPNPNTFDPKGSLFFEPSWVVSRAIPVSVYIQSCGPG
jgi:hypothetical protein